MIIPSAANDPVFDTTDSFAALFADTDEDAMVEALERNAQAGLVLRKLRVRGAAADAPIDGVLLGGPDANFGVVVLLEADATGGGMAPSASWPFDRGGPLTQFTPHAIRLHPGGHMAVVEGEACAAELRVFDACCLAAEHLVQGRAIGARLNGWAFQIERADNTPDHISLASLPPETAAIFARGVDPDGYVTFHKEAMTGLMPLSDVEGRPLYAVRGPVRGIEPAMAFEGQSIQRIRVAIAREGEDELEVLLDFNTTIWGQIEAPAIDDDIEAIIWLQAVFGEAAA